MVDFADYTKSNEKNVFKWRKYLQKVVGKLPYTIIGRFGQVTKKST